MIMLQKPSLAAHPVRRSQGKVIAYALPLFVDRIFRVASTIKIVRKLHNLQRRQTAGQSGIVRCDNVALSLIDGEGRQA